MHVKAKAKLNLFFQIIGKRDDGYHLMQSLMVFADDIYDSIEITPAIKNQTIVENGEFSYLLKNEPQNLIDKALNTFAKEQYYKCVLSKDIPIGAGLGGGSSDAAVIAKFLANSAEMDKNINKKLTNIGADLPICYHHKAAFCSGIGEIIQPIENFPKLYLVLVNPRKPLLTASVFKNNHQINTPAIMMPNSFTDLNSMLEFLLPLKNDLTQAAIGLMPEIKSILELISSQAGCSFSQMSGSGPTCFGVFNNRQAAEQAYNNIKSLEPNYWVKYTSAA